MSGYGTVRMGVGSPATSLSELVDTVTELPGQRLTLETHCRQLNFRSACGPLRSIAVNLTSDQLAAL